MFVLCFISEWLYSKPYLCNVQHLYIFCILLITENVASLLMISFTRKNEYATWNCFSMNRNLKGSITTCFYKIRHQKHNTL